MVRHWYIYGLIFFETIYGVLIMGAWHEISRLDRLANLVGERATTVGDERAMMELSKPKTVSTCFQHEQIDTQLHSHCHL